MATKTNNSGLQISNALKTSVSGMQAQKIRMRITTENLANANMQAQNPNQDPYRAKTITFKEVIDPRTGTSQVSVAEIGRSQQEFYQDYDPSHPGADENGIVKRSNVNTMLELMNMREAQRSHEANLQAYEANLDMQRRSLDLLKAR